MRRFLLSGLALALSLASLNSAAETGEGVIVYSDTLCNLYIIQTNTGFALGRWMGGWLVVDRTLIYGNLNTVGMVDIVSGDPRDPHKTQFFLEVFGLSQDRAVEKFREKCH